eukprot:scaffold55425_cov24-Tisochrysis_lutea.AAC.1
MSSRSQLSCMSFFVSTTVPRKEQTPYQTQFPHTSPLTHPALQQSASAAIDSSFSSSSNFNIIISSNTALLQQQFQQHHYHQQQQQQQQHSPAALRTEQRSTHTHWRTFGATIKMGSIWTSIGTLEDHKLGACQLVTDLPCQLVTDLPCQLVTDLQFLFLYGSTHLAVEERAKVYTTPPCSRIFLRSLFFWEADSCAPPALLLASPSPAWQHKAELRS